MPPDLFVGDPISSHLSQLLPSRQSRSAIDAAASYVKGFPFSSSVLEPAVAVEDGAYVKKACIDTKCLYPRAKLTTSSACLLSYLGGGTVC